MYRLLMGRGARFCFSVSNVFTALREMSKRLQAGLRQSLQIKFWYSELGLG